MVEGQTVAEFAEEPGAGEFIIKAVSEETAVFNPHLTSSQLKEGITMDRNDPTQIKDVNFSRLGIKALPELFGHLKIDGSLNLQNNALTSLPESMGSMKVAEDLDLSFNALTCLPASMGSIQVGGNLDLRDNNLRYPKPTKADFPNVEGSVKEAGF